MKHLKMFGSIIVLMSLTVACKNEKPAPGITGLPSIGAYFQPVTNQSLKLDAGSAVGGPAEAAFTNQVNTAAPDSYRMWYYKPNGTQVSTPGYDEIAKEYNDVNFNPTNRVPCFTGCFRTKMSRIDVTAADNFSASYPEGSSLNSLFSVVYDDPEAFIDAGYDFHVNFQKIKKSLDAFNDQTNGKLMPLDMEIWMTTVPEGITPFEHGYKVQYSFTDGSKVVTAITAQQ